MLACAVRWSARLRLGQNARHAPQRMYAPRPTVETLVAGVLAQDRAALSKAITLVESSLPKHRREAAQLLSAVRAGSNENTFRICISGPPGAGKSSFIEALGALLTAHGHRLAVLAVDPSSALTGGSILGDKTRMPELSINPNAYVRPSPSRGESGGIVRHTFETIGLVEAGGFDVVIVETVGVGQGELDAEGMVDMFVLLHPPGSGDELQGIKRGVMEMADLILVTKCDGHLKKAARHAVADLRRALQLHRPKHEFWQRRVAGHTNALEEEADDKYSTQAVWTQMQEFRAASKETGHWTTRRHAQVHSWLLHELRCGATERLQRHLRSTGKVGAVLPSLCGGEKSPREAVEEILDEFCA